MSREQRVTVTRNGVSRDYLVVYREAPPERAEAVHFFQTHADRLLPGSAIPTAVEHMPLGDANAYLRKHPIEEQWSLLSIRQDNAIRDEDLARLRHVPELEHVKISSSEITDAGVRYLLLLPNLKHLLLYSSRVTDHCLQDIQKMRSLVSLDLQGTPNLSREAVLQAVAAMPWLRDVWPPPDPDHLAECRRRVALSRDGLQDQPRTEATAEQPQPAETLRHVILDRQPIPRPPDDLFRKDDIGRLDLIHCGIESLPDAIGNLTQLRTLYASGGRLTRLPDTIGKLTALEYLWLNENQLSRLPDSFRCLRHLKKLALDSNQLKAFPEVILHLTELEELRLTDNRLSTLPDGIGKLTALQSLSLGRNKLKTVPRAIGKLQRLTYLGLQGNPLRSLPDELWELPCLVTLNLAHTGFTKLPPAAAKIPISLGCPSRGCIPDTELLLKPSRVATSPHGNIRE